MGLSEKAVLVTGGGTGIGRAAAQALAAEGARVMVAGRREEKLRETAAGYDGPGEIASATVDVADLASVQSLCRQAEETLGRVDVLLNSSGVNVAKRSMAELSPADWEKLLQINATGAYYLMTTLLPGMRRRGDGLIMNVSSIAGKRASLLGGVGYSASKFAMTALGLTAALEEGDHGVRITNIYPGEVNTPILENRPQPVSDEHKARILQPEDVAAAVVMIAKLPPRAHVPEFVIKPTTQEWV